MNFFDTNLNQYLTERGVQSRYGSQVISWDSSRLESLGLYKAYTIPSSYNKYSYTLSASTWTYYADYATALAAYPDLENILDEFTFPAYLGIRSEVALSGAALTSATAQAEARVAAEVEKRLAEVAAWENASFESTTLSAYKNALANIGSDPNYPAVLAYEVDQGGFDNWPVKPTIDVGAGPVSTGTNADVAFRQLVLSYSIPGSYPEKVTAMDNAVATYGENGAVEDLYNAAVTELNS